MDDKELCVIWLVAIFNETVILACWRVDMVIASKSGIKVEVKNLPFQVDIINVMKLLVLGEDNKSFN